jgi:predicted dehydrogenase
MHVLHNKNPVSVGLIGVRGYGQRLINLIKNTTHLRLHSCFHTNADVAKKSCADMGFQKYFTNLDEFLIDPELECVILAVPNNYHFEYTIKALEHSKHVWVEKPIANTFHEAQTMLDLSYKMKKVLMVGHNHREMGHISEISKLLQQGKIGQVVAAEFNMSHGGGLKFTNDKWRFHKELCPGGPLNMLGSHLIDSSNYLFGEVSSISGYVQNLYAETSAEDMSFLTLRYQTGVLVNIVNLYNSVSTEFINIYGTQGAIRFSRWPEEKLFYQPKDVSLEAENYQVINFEKVNSQEILFKKFLDLMRENNYESSNAKSSTEVIRIMEKAITKQ